MIVAEPQNKNVCFFLKQAPWPPLGLTNPFEMINSTIEQWINAFLRYRTFSKNVTPHPSRNIKTTRKPP